MRSGIFEEYHAYDKLSWGFSGQLPIGRANLLQERQLSTYQSLLWYRVATRIVQSLNQIKLAETHQLPSTLSKKDKILRRIELLNTQAPPLKFWKLTSSLLSW